MLTNGNMIRMSGKTLTAGSPAMAIAGCASQAVNHGFALVERLVAERTGLLQPVAGVFLSKRYCFLAWHFPEKRL